jgi:hypothetical protein
MDGNTIRSCFEPELTPLQCTLLRLLEAPLSIYAKTDL